MITDDRQVLAAPLAHSCVTRLARIVAWAAAAAALLTLPAVAARAGTVEATAPQLVSGLTPLPRAGTTGECGTGAKRQDWEQDNSLAVNPRNRDNLVAAWIQDWADAIVVGYSFDGGKNWTKSVPPTTPCTLGSLGTPPGLEALYGAAKGRLSAIDPWVSFDAGGTVYLSAILPEASGFLVSALVVNRSIDGGRTWSAPVPVDTAAAPLAVDGSSITADPGHAGRADVTWWRQDLAGCGTRRQYVSHTQDGGISWSPPLPVPVEPGHVHASGQLIVLDDGTLVDVATEIPTPDCPLALPSGPTSVLVRGSIDGGITWSAPVTVGRAEGLASASAALAPDGETVYASWQTRKPGSSDFSVRFSRSTDRGRTWAPEAAVAEDLAGPPEANQPYGVLAAPSLAVAADGAVGVGFYDHRSDLPSATPPHGTDYWFRHSHDGGASWEEEHLGGPFDQWSFPDGDGSALVGSAPGFLGDYQGIAPVAGGFAVNFALGMPSASKNDDIFFSYVRLLEPDLQITKITGSKTTGVRAGDKVTLTATVENVGDDVARPSSTTFLVDGGILGVVGTGSVAPGATTEVSLGWDTTSANGEHVVVAVADSADLVHEANENNNRAQLAVTVRGNHVRNGSFEQSANGTSPDSWSSSGWTAYEGGGSDGLRSVSTGPGGSWTSETVPIEGGGSYDASVVAAGAGGMLLAQQLAADGTLLTSTAQPLLPTGLFTLTSVHLTTLTGATQARVVLVGGLTGKTTFDDVGLFSG